LLASLNVTGDTRLSTVGTSGAAAFGGAMTVSGVTALYGAATAQTVATTNNSTAIATTAFVHNLVATISGSATISGDIGTHVTFLQGITVSGTTRINGALSSGSSTGTAGQVLTSTGTATQWTTPLIGVTSNTYNTALGVGAGDSTPAPQYRYNTTIGYNAQVPNQLSSHQIAIGTSGETIYVQGGLYLNVGPQIADPLPFDLSLRPVAQFYTISAQNLASTGSIALPTAASSRGADILFRFTSPSNGLVSFQSYAGNIVPLSTDAPEVTFVPPVGTYVVRLTSDGTSWYQTQ
jgi:hypothetical protein